MKKYTSNCLLLSSINSLAACSSIVNSLSSFLESSLAGFLLSSFPDFLSVLFKFSPMFHLFFDINGITKSSFFFFIIVPDKEKNVMI